MEAEKALGDVAAGQHGLVTRGQALERGVSSSTLKRWCDGKRLHPVHAGVYRMNGAPRTWEQSVLAAVLASGPGAVASHRTAARLWGLLDTDVVEVSVGITGSARLGGVVVHRARDLGPRWTSRVRRIPVTNPYRVLADLGAVVPAACVEDALDRGLVQRQVTVVGVERVYDALRSRGRRGLGALREVLDRRALGADRPDGLLEPRMARVLRRYGLPPASFQHEVRDAGRLVARVDFAYPGTMLAIEVDGFEAHSSPRALRRDLERQNALVALGWTVLRFTWHDVVRRPRKVAATLAPFLPAA